MRAAGPTAIRREYFAEYAEIVAEAIGDVGGMWITVNEPQVVAHEGYRIGMHAPGHSDEALAAAATHHLLLGHGLALARLRSALPGARVGIALDMHPIRTVGDRRGRGRSRSPTPNRTGSSSTRSSTGAIPAKAREHLLPPPSLIHDGDMELMSAPIDFLGVNYYSPQFVKLADSSTPRAEETPIPGTPGVVTVKPAGLPSHLPGLAHRARRSLRPSVGRRLGDRAGLLDLRDRERLRRRGLRRRPKASSTTSSGSTISTGTSPPPGARSRTASRSPATSTGRCSDNFEWAWGYQKRFGLVFVDFPTQRRIPKRSAGFYGRIARANALPAAAEREHLAAGRGAAERARRRMNALPRRRSVRRTGPARAAPNGPRSFRVSRVAASRRRMRGRTERARFAGRTRGPRQRRGPDPCRCLPTRPTTDRRSRSRSAS